MSKHSPSSSSKGTTASKQARTGDPVLKTVAELIKSGKARKIVVLTGAGISTSAGIPDFRSPETGLYANLQALDLPFPEAVFELNYFRENPKPFWTLAKELYPGKHHPTPTHYFLKLLNDHNLLQRVFTQNIDTLEHLTGLPPSKIIEAHGSFASAHCIECGVSVSTEYVLSAGVRRGEIVKCPAEDGCGGLVKPDIVFFGENLPEKFFSSIKDLSICDLLIVIGTSLQVQPFSLLPNKTGTSVPRLLINREPVGPFEDLESGSGGASARNWRSILSGQNQSRSGDMFWKGDADDGIRKLCEELGWGEKLDKAVKEGKERLEAKWRLMEKLTDANTDGRAVEADSTIGEVKKESGSGKVGENEEKVVEEVKEEMEGKTATDEVKTDGVELEDLQKAIEKDLKIGSSL